MHALWTPAELPEHDCLFWQAGPLELWLRRRGVEWCVAVRRHEGEPVPTDARGGVPAIPPEDLEWVRWAVGPERSEAVIRPRLPDRPVVVRPESPVFIPSGQRISFFVSIPLWLGIAVGQHAEDDLVRHPTVVLSDTWFGDPMDGRLCYSLRTTARQSIRDFVPTFHRAISPVNLTNESKQTLEFRRFCLAVKHLDVYEGHDRLFANSVHVTYRGEDHDGVVRYSDKAPSLDGLGVKLSAAPEPAHASLIQRTIDRLGWFS